MNWILKRKDTDAQINLPRALQWEDEFNWSKVAQTEPVYSLSGAVLIQQGTKQAGRLITLSGEWVWHDKQDLERLQEWSEVPELEMTLVHYDGRQFNVIFRNHQQALSNTHPVRNGMADNNKEPYITTINFITI